MKPQRFKVLLDGGFPCPSIQDMENGDILPLQSLEIVMAEGVAALESENESLRAEIENLKDYCVSDADVARKILNYLGFSQHESMEPGCDRRRDHISEMIYRNRVAPQKLLSADEVTEPGWYWTRVADGQGWVVADVYESTRGVMTEEVCGSEQENFLRGQFIGPLTPPEV